jgi:hypothetical protein
MKYEKFHEQMLVTDGRADKEDEKKNVSSKIGKT